MQVEPNSPEYLHCQSSVLRLRFEAPLVFTLASHIRLLLRAAVVPARGHVQCAWQEWLPVT
jgi:hypothetical protein